MDEREISDAGEGFVREGSVGEGWSIGKNAGMEGDDRKGSDEGEGSDDREGSNGEVESSLTPILFLLLLNVLPLATPIVFSSGLLTPGPKFLLWPLPLATLIILWLLPLATPTPIFSCFALSSNGTLFPLATPTFPCLESPPGVFLLLFLTILLPSTSIFS